MAFAAMPVDEGIRAGADRAARYGLSVSAATEEVARELAREAIDRADVVVSEGGSAFFAEFVAVSVIARSSHGEAELQLENLVTYLNHTLEVGNTFFHA